MAAIEEETKSPTDIQTEMNSARSNVVDAEKEISSIKMALRNLSQAVASAQSTSTDDTDENGEKKEESKDRNSLKFLVTKISGLPDSAQPIIHVELSNPVEKQTITSFTDDSEKPNDGEETNENTTGDSNKEKQNKEHATFYEVETSNATFEINVFDNDIPLGCSAVHDIKPLCQLNLLQDNQNDVIVSNLDVAIVPREEESSTVVERKVEVEATNDTDSNSFDTAVEEEEAKKVSESAGVEEVEAIEKEQSDKVVNEERTTEDGENEPKGTGENTTHPRLEVPTCVLTIKTEYTPSMKDKKEELYDLLNKASKKKARAIDELRKSAAALSRIKSGGNDSKDAATTAVKSGFLQKKTKETKQKEPMFLVRWYQRFLGPTSIVQRVFPIAKNYILFFGGVAIMHFHGQILALPAPV